MRIIPLRPFSLAWKPDLRLMSKDRWYLQLLPLFFTFDFSSSYVTPRAQDCAEEIRNSPIERFTRFDEFFFLWNFDQKFSLRCAFSTYVYISSRNWFSLKNNGKNEQLLLKTFFSKFIFRDFLLVKMKNFGQKKNSSNRMNLSLGLFLISSAQSWPYPNTVWHPLDWALGTSKDNNTCIHMPISVLQLFSYQTANLFQKYLLNTYLRATVCLIGYFESFWRKNWKFGGKN